MRYADGPTVQLTRTIAAPPDDVWRLVSDIGLPARFSSEFLGAEWLDPPGGGAGIGLGSTFQGHNRHPVVGEWSTTSTVVAFEPGHTFAWAVGDPEQPSATWRFDLEPDSAGTRVTFTARMGPAPSGLTAAIEAMPDKEERIVERRLEEFRRNMEATLEGVAALTAPA